jgi:hypothetical protein
MPNKREKLLAIIIITVDSTSVTCKKNNQCLMTGNVAMGLPRARIGGLRPKLNSMAK